MAGNEWINSYLEAILDAGSKTQPQSSSDPLETATAAAAALGPTSWYSPTKYFVEEVVNRFDDADLHKTWVKVVATRNSEERNNRLENMCWRIWHLARKKKKIAWEDARRLALRQMEREEGIKDAVEDLSELSEGEKDVKESVDSPKTSIGKISRINSDVKMFWPDVDDSVKTPAKRLYIVLISLHGLVRGENMELGRDSDTGGQVKYVVELARALAATRGVYRVDLLTRQISSPDVDWTYGEPVEMLTRPADTDTSGDGCGAYIIRLPCGPRELYIPKESLWPHVPEFVDRALAHITDVARSLGELPDGGGRPAWPYVVHGHYADAAACAARLCGALNVPMVMTGHSLGRNKLEQLLKQGRLSRGEIRALYRIERRVEAEELGLDAAEMVVTSTRQEIEEQWGLYDGFDVRLERKLRVRRRRGVTCLGRYMPRMVVIPPGMDFSHVTPQDVDGDGDLSSLIGFDRTQIRSASAKRDLPPIWSEIMRFFTNPHKPMILALSRPDPKKNVATLLKAFGECQPLRKLANMTLILGNRDDVEEMPSSSATVMTTVLKLVDRYDLYGKVAYPKHHKQSDVPQIYRLAAKTKGVFINPALVEPFGLTIIEASAYGLPVVATKNGGPVDIIKVLNNGLLIDPHDHTAIADALLKLVAEKGLWLDCRRNGLKNIHHFSWPEHCKNYLSHVEHCRNRHPTSYLDPAPRAEEPMSDSLRDVDDLSIRFSVDGTSDVKAANGDVGAMVEALRRHRAERGAQDDRRSPGYGPGLRQRVFVIAADCYAADGQFAAGDLAGIIEKLKGIGGGGGRTGFVFSTGSNVAETSAAIIRCGVDPGEFDALICCSGSEVYYPWRDLVADGDYDAHVENRWPEDNVKSAVLRVAKLEDGAEVEDDLAIDEEASSSHCYAYSLRPGAKVRKVDAIRQRLRMRGFRCNLVYTRAATRLNVIPLFASRALALRYLSVRWGIDLAKMVVFVGERGDTDHEELLPGLHKTLILGGLVPLGSEGLLRDVESYLREDVVPLDSPNIVSLAEGYDAAEILGVIESIGIK